MPPAARIGDLHVCPMVDGLKPHVGGPVALGSPTVLIGFMPAARAGDQCVCIGPPDVIAKGSPTVLINGMPAARMGDLTVHGGTITVGFPQVLIGEMGMGSPGGAAGGSPGAAAAGGGGGSSAGSSAGAPAGGSAPPANGPYDSADEAARAALDAANPQSISDNVEYSGLIYQGADGKFYYTGPARGTDQGANPLADAPAPAGTTVVGDYHTHGDYSTVDPATGAAVRTSDPSKDEFNSDNFSSTDKADSDTQGYPGYLGTPSGTYRKYDPADKSDTVL